MNKFKHYLNKLFLSLLALGLLLLLFFTTDPNKVALPVLIAPFLLIGFIVYQLTAIVARRQTKRAGHITRLVPISIAMLVVLLLLLASLHQLTWRDGMLALLFTGAFWLYVHKADFLK